MRSLFALLLSIVSLHVNAQEILGRILDEKREPFVSANVSVYLHGVYKGSTPTDYDGNFDIRYLEPGIYDVVIAHEGYDTFRVNDVLVASGEQAPVNFTMPGVKGCCPASHIVQYKKPFTSQYPSSLTGYDKIYFMDGHQFYMKSFVQSRVPMIDVYNPTSVVLNRKQIEHMPYTDINDIVAAVTGFYQKQRGAGISVFGSRVGANSVIYEGIHIN